MYVRTRISYITSKSSSSWYIFSFIVRWWKKIHIFQCFCLSSYSLERTNNNDKLHLMDGWEHEHEGIKWKYIHTIFYHPRVFIQFPLMFLHLYNFFSLLRTWYCIYRILLSYSLCFYYVKCVCGYGFWVLPLLITSKWWNFIYKKIRRGWRRKKNGKSFMLGWASWVGSCQGVMGVWGV